MDKKAPEGNSSSPSDKFTISGIQVLKNNQYRIDFPERDSLVIDKFVFLQENLYAGLKLSEEDLISLQIQSKTVAAERQAIKLLSSYLHSTYSLKIKLLKRGYDEEIISRVIARLKITGLLNDFEYARSWVMARIARHPESRHVLTAGLQKRGVPGDIASQVVAELITEDQEIASIKKIIDQKTHKTNLSEAEIQKLLLSRGFSYQMIKNSLEYTNKFTN